MQDTADLTQVPTTYTPDTLLPIALEVKELPPSLSFRLAAFERIDPRIITALPRWLLENLAIAENPSQLADEVLQRNDNNPSRALSEIVMILHHPDMVDFLLRLKPNINPQEVIPFAENWKNYWISHYANPANLPPKKIGSYQDFLEYARIILPIRLESEKALPIRTKKNIYELHKLVMTLPQASEEIFDLYKYSFTAMDNQSIQALTNAARIALDLARDNPQLQEQVVSGIVSAIQAQDKWWILGGEDLDRLTWNLLQLLVKKRVPNAASIILDTLYRKAYQDEPAVYAAFFPPRDATFTYTLSKTLGIQTLIDLALQANPQEVTEYLGKKFAESGASRLITEEIITRPELHSQTIYLGRTREIAYFGKKFHLAGLPQDEDITLTELSFGIYAAQPAKKDRVWFFQTDPFLFASAEIITASPLPLENLVYWTYQEKQPIPPEKAQKFVADFPHLIKEISASLQNERRSYTLLPLGSFYQLWEYLETQPPQERKRIYEYVKHYGVYAVFSFLVSEHGKENIPRLINFAEATYIPRIREREGDTHSIIIRAKDTFTEEVFQRFTDIYQEAWHYAHLIEKDPQRRVIVADLILQRAKAMLIATAKIYENGTLSPEEKHYILQSFEAYQLFLIALADETGEMAKRFHVPYSLLREMFVSWDIEDPDNRALYYSVFELWYKSSLARQEQAEYRGRVREITLSFYREYAELEADCEKTTAPPSTLEDARYLGDLEEEFATEYLPQRVPEGEIITIGFWGAGKLRAEKRIMAYIMEKINATEKDNKGYQFIAVDLKKPTELPNYPHLTYHEMDMTEIGKRMPNTFNKIYLIWSPLMDVLELDELKMVFASIAQSIKPGGRVIIDVHFPFGKHSYQSLIQNHHIAHPEDPFQLFARSFDRGEGKAPIGKMFAGWDPFTLIPLARIFGMKCINFPTQPAEIEALCRKAEEDDNFIPAGSQDNMKKQALYRTESQPPWNRVSYIFEMEEDKPDPQEVLARLKNPPLESILTFVS